MCTVVPHSTQVLAEVYTLSSGVVVDPAVLLALVLAKMVDPGAEVSHPAGWLVTTPGW